MRKKTDPAADDESLEEGPSKSAVKREMLALQALGESLAELNDKQLAALKVDDERLLSAIHEARRIRSNSARKRHMQFIGKLMRDIDTQPIAEALDAMRRPARQQNQRFHDLEQLREDVLSAGPSGVELVLKRWPEADRQQLRQLVLQHQRELQKNKALGASRRLFRYLRQLQELYGEAPDDTDGNTD